MRLRAPAARITEHRPISIIEDLDAVRRTCFDSIDCRGLDSRERALRLLAGGSAFVVKDQGIASHMIS